MQDQYLQQNHGGYLLNKNNLEDQIKEFIDSQPELRIEIIDKHYVLAGKYAYNSIWKKVVRAGEREVIIHIPFAFPLEAPQLFVIDIPEGMNHIYSDNSVCLATTGEIISFLSKNPTLKEFAAKFIESFLFSINWFADYGTYPFGEREHGWQGLKSYYLENWGLTSNQYRTIVLMVYNNSYRGHNLCICGSGLKMRKCHGVNLLPILSNRMLKEQFLTEALQILQGEKNGKK